MQGLRPRERIFRPWRSPEALRSEIDKIAGEIHALEVRITLLRAAKIDVIEFPTKRKFEERGVDVILQIYARWASDHDVMVELDELYGDHDQVHYGPHRDLRIELKPAVGDDFRPYCGR